MKFEDFINQGNVRQGTSDISKIKSLLETSKNHLSFLENQKINEISAGSILVTYYEALREIIEAICLKEGFKVYSHEAFTYFLKEKDEDLVSVKFDNLRKLRNSINYYGEKVNVNEVTAAKIEIIGLIKYLKNKYLSKFSDDYIKMDVKAINLDFYGTLVDWLHIWIDASEKIVNENNLRLSPKEFALEWRKMQRKLFEDKESIQYEECTTSALNMLCQKYQIKNKNYNKILFSKWKEIKPFPEVTDVLRKLKEKYKLAICSNSSRDLFDVCADKIPIKFEYVFISDETKVNKPHLKMYQYAIKALGFPTKNILHIASSQMDVKGATNAGLSVCWINRLNEKISPETPEPKFEIRKLDEVFGILED